MAAAEKLRAEVSQASADNQLDADSQLDALARGEKQVDQLSQRMQSANQRWWCAVNRQPIHPECHARDESYVREQAAAAAVQFSARGQGSPTLVSA